jgi:1,4-alpha-glucan branching enzyme
MKKLNEAVYGNFPDAITIAEESTAWPMVTKPTYMGGLGFGMKWMMGWMNDTLQYFSKDPVYRRHHQNLITFSMHYYHSEHFLLSLSHDEVVHGKNSMTCKMPGDEWQRFAHLRCLYAYMYAHPGNKLLFMGMEFGQTSEWHHETSLDWHLLEHDYHQGVRELVCTINHLYRTESPLHASDYLPDGFEWIDMSDEENSVLSFLRKDKGGQRIMIICNLTPLPRNNYRTGLPEEGHWRIILNTDDERFGGSGYLSKHAADIIPSTPVTFHGRPFSMVTDLPPLSVLYIGKIG